MRVAVIGGRLQGVEAAYLAGKTGWEVILIDRDSDTPASGLCHCARKVDVTDQASMISALQDVNFVIPALEDPEALAALETISSRAGIPLAFDSSANWITRSKLKSNELFSFLGIPIPKPWPECGLPVVCKPSDSSGSRGVRVARNHLELQAVFGLPGISDWVIQQFVDGPLYSIEVLGFRGAYFPLQVTDLKVDRAYDCKRVLAPTALPPSTVYHFKDVAVRIAEALRLNGVMDVEAILHHGELKVLEIDARLPSQTPTAVFSSSRMNIVEMLGEIFFYSREPKTCVNSDYRGVIFEHVRLSPGLLEFSGEHIIAKAGPLKLLRDFFGADEALTNYCRSGDSWVATLITTGRDCAEAREKRDDVIKNIRMHCKVNAILDPGPESTGLTSRFRSC